MTRSRKKGPSRAYRTYVLCGSGSFTPTTGYCGVADVIAIDTIIDGLTNQGQELQIGSATLELECHEVHDQDGRSPATLQPCIIIADADISSHNSTVAYPSLDQLLELCTSGDLEFIQLGLPRMNKIAGPSWWHAGDSEEKEDRFLRFRFDITSHLQRIAKIFQRPGDDEYYCDLVVAYWTGNQSVYTKIHAMITFEYVLVEKRFTI